MSAPALPIESKERPLRYLFLDLNSYFASVEQQEFPQLRGKPVAVVPVEADTSFVIAASYEAKRAGVKTLTQIGEAKRLCPDLICVLGHHAMYSAYHKRVIDAAETVLPVDKVCSIDEMRFKLLKSESAPAVAIELALRIKTAVREQVGECLTSSIGIAPNAFLAKVGTEMQKPDGLVVIQSDDLPQALHRLKLTDFPGINRRMEVRLNAAGVFSVEQMCAASRGELARAFGSLVGERWWFLLRGFDVPTPDHFGSATEELPKSLGNSHVLAPELRTPQGCREVLLRLIQKASARLRKEGLWTEEMLVSVVGFTRSWQVRIKLPTTQDTITLNEHFLQEWERIAPSPISPRTDGRIAPSPISSRSDGGKAPSPISSRTDGRIAPSPISSWKGDGRSVGPGAREIGEGVGGEVSAFIRPKQVGVTFTRLRRAEHVTPSLFDPTLDRALLSRAVDSVNQRFGKNKVYLAGMEHAKESADEKIAFGKTELFSEGAGDHEWVDTFRGLPRRPEASNPSDPQTEE